MTDLSEQARSRASFGSLALLVAFIMIPLQAVSEFRDAWATLTAILLAILGVGLRIEAAILRGQSGARP